MSSEAKKSERPLDAGSETDRKPFLTKARLTAAALALGGMVIGSIVGIAVQVGVESTGMLGPSVEALIAEQESNFDEIGARIESLRGMASSPESSKALNELETLLARQGELRLQANNELAYLGGQVASLRDEALQDRGFAGGADFWLDVGESVSVGDERHVLGVVRTWGNAVDVNLNGKKSRLTVGDSISVGKEGGDCAVFVKQARRKEDGRVGFDVSCG